MRKLSTSSGQFRHAKKNIFQRIQILQWLPHYKKRDFISDVVGGITVGLMMIPQSIAYAGLASLPAQYGLYTAFIGSFTYIIFGTIQQVSIGPTSLLSMLAATYVQRFSVDYIILLTFLSGCIELAMGLLNLGFLVDFISPPVSAGFTSAISIIIMVSQVSTLLGLEMTSHTILEVIWMIPQNIRKMKISDTTVGLCSILFLFAFKQISKVQVKNKAAKKLIWLLSISRNALIVLITSSIAYYYCQVKGTPPFALSPTVPSGLPEFSLPKFSTTLNNETVSFFNMIHTLGSSIFVVPICAIFTNVAIAKSFASGVILDSSQEMITLGLCNLFGSCVQAMPSTGAFSRSAVANASGVRTPMQGLYSGTLIILALSFLTPYFQFIPKATLAAVLVSAVSTMIDYEILPVLWRTNKMDFFLAVLTCTVGVTYGADIGIIVGATLNLIVLLKEWSRPNIVIKLRTWKTSSKLYLLIKPEFGLCYPAGDFLTEKVMEAHNQYETLPIVLDCSSILKIDYAAAKALHQLMEFYNQDNDKFIMINLNTRVQETLQKLTGAEKMKFCQSNSTICGKLFEMEKQAETKVLLES